MTSFLRKLKTFSLLWSTRSPLTAMTEAVRHLLPLRPTPQVAAIKELTQESPLILQIETINACNARCVFCAYPRMKREKGVMSISLFKKTVKEYAQMGGGAVSLTPIQGEPLLDPHLLRRIRILERNPAINQVSTTTNAIAMDRYSDEEVGYLLETLDFIQVSIGGLDAETYRTMYGVDKYDRVQRAMDRILELNEHADNPPDIAFAFRTTDWQFEHRFRQELDAYREQGVLISHVWTYNNYAGMVSGDDEQGLVVNDGPATKSRPCALACIHMAVCWDGRITACGCADAEGRGLQLGRVDQDSLADVWSAGKRTALLDAFEKGTLPDLCRNCSAYQPDNVFATPAFKEVRPADPLPVEFYHQFWGG